MQAHELDLAPYRASGLQISFHSGPPLGRTAAARLRCRSLAFSYFIERRLRERGLWGPRRKSLDLIVSPRIEERTWADAAVARAEFSGHETDDELVAALAAAFAAPLAQCVPGARLDVLADEFLEAGCTLTLRTPRLTAARVVAQLEFRLGMEAFEASLEVQSQVGSIRYPTMIAGPDRDFWPLFGKLSVSARRVVLRAVPSASFVRDTGKRRHVFRTGVGSAARRYVIELGSDGTQRVAQQWELTGPGGKSTPGSGLVTRNASTSGRAMLPGS